MTQREALRHPHRQAPPPGCAGELIDPRRGFWGDVAWVAFDRAAGGARVVAVGGGVHWRNHEPPPAPPTD